MTPSDNETGKGLAQLNTVVDIVVRLAVLAFLLGWCILILQPFMSLILWGIIIAVAIYPVYESLRKRLKGRSGLAATLISLFFLLALLIPTLLLADSLAEGIVHIRDIYREGQLVIPAPGEQVKNWPMFMKPVADFWKLASENLQAAVSQFQEPVKKALGWVLSFLMGAGMGILQLLASIIVAGVILGYSDSGSAAIKRVFVRLAGDRSHSYAELSTVTIRNVVKGILGVAATQSLLAGIGFFVAGVPLAGLWTLIALIFAIVQVGVGPVVIPVVIYVFMTAEPLTAWLFLGWSILVLVSDNVLKPFLLGRKAPVPMLVVFLGSVGGFISSGFLGLFLGPVMLSLGYILYNNWVEIQEGVKNEE